MPEQMPEPKSSRITASDFQDNPTVLTWIGWDRKPNEDDPSNYKSPRKWDQKIKFCLPYTYPEMAINKETGEQMKGKDDKPFTNKYWEPDCPHGWTPVYHFEEGDLEAGSLPLYERLCQMQPKKGEKIRFLRTGQNRDTKWDIKRFDELTMSNVNTTPQGPPDMGVDPLEEVPLGDPPPEMEPGQ